MASPTTDRRQGLTGGVAIKAPVDCATTANITLSGEQSIDGVTTSQSRVLVKNQTNTVQNGIYDSNSSAWTRALDANGNYDLKRGTVVGVASGGQLGKFFQVTTSNPITVDSSAIVWTQSPAVGGSAAVYSVTSSLPDGFNTANDATTYIQAALNSGATVVDFIGLALKCDSVTVPAGVWAKNVNLTKYTNAAGNVMLVNTGCTITGKISGSGLTGAIQRCVYPAADGVTDVCLLLEVTNATVGVHAQYLTTDTDPHRPKRWHGYIYAHDIVGVAGNSEGYGVLMSPADACQLTVNAKTIARHAVYLSAGAQDNDIDLTVDACSNYAAQMYSTTGQGATQRNRMKINYRNPAENVAGQGGAIAIVQKAHYNTVVVNMEGNGITTQAVRVEGASGGPYPLSNKVIDGSITGQFIGTDVIFMQNADSTVVTRNRLDCYATASVIASRKTGTNGITHGGYIHDNQINAQGQAIRGIYAEVTTVPTFIGINDIRNNGAALRVDDSTGGKRQGFSRRVTFSGTTAAISATSSGDTTVTLPDNIQTTGRAAFVELSGSSVQFFDKPFWSAVTGAPSETQATVRIYNGHSAGQTFNFYGSVEGD